jgi:hypothetical protein
MNFIFLLSWYSDGLQAGWPGFKSWQGQEIFLYSTAFRLALGSIQPPIQYVPGTVYLGVKCPVREADYSPPSGANVKNGGAVSTLSCMSSWHDD